MPVWETMKQMVDAKELNYDSKILLFHEKHGSAFRTLQKYI